jgi:hypothetical protein
MLDSALFADPPVLVDRLHDGRLLPLLEVTDLPPELFHNTQWAIVYFGQFLRISEVAHIFGLHFSIG